MSSAGDRIIQGLKDAVEGRVARVIFTSVDLGPGDNLMVFCPVCDVRNLWTTRLPKKCQGCKTPFHFNMNGRVASAFTDGRDAG